MSTGSCGCRSWPPSRRGALAARRGGPGQAADGQRHRGAAASVDPLATNAAIDVLRGAATRIDAAIAAASVLGVVEPYSCGIGGGGFMTIRDGRSGRITTIDSREIVAEGHEAGLVLHQRPAADRRAVPDQPLQRAQHRRAGHARAVGLRHAPLRHDRPRQGAVLRRERRPQRLRRRPDVLRPDGSERAVLRRRPVDRRDLPRPRRHAARRRHHDQEPGPREDVRPARPQRRARGRSTTATSATRSSAPPTTRRSRRPPTTRGGPAC